MINLRGVLYQNNVLTSAKGANAKLIFTKPLKPTIFISKRNSAE
jgi:hypothetical protein